MLVLAQEEARLLEHAFIGTEHLLLGLIGEGEDVAAHALRSSGVTLEETRERVEQAIGKTDGNSGSSPFTPQAKKVLELSLREALRLGDQFISTGHLLLGLLREGEGLAVQVLVGAGTDLNELRDEVLGRLGTERPAGPERERAVRRCLFCGLEVGAATHFVSASGGVAICSDCVAEAGQALEAADGEAEVFLPLRIVGVPPDEEAARSIVDAIDAALVSDSPLAARRAAVEDFDELQPFLTLAARAAPTTATAVARVRFVNDTTAIADFQSFAGGVGTFHTVRVTSDGSRWYIPFDAMRTLLAGLGVAVPRRPDALGTD